MEFWTWLFKLSRRKVREAHMKKHHNDIKCPNCNHWFSVSGVDANHAEIAKPKWGFSVMCGACKHVSHWNAVAAPVLLLCDESGTPT